MAITKLENRRRGSMFILTLSLVLVMGILVAAAFTFIRTTTAMDTIARIENQEQINVSDIMRQARDSITAFNIDRHVSPDAVLHNNVAEKMRLVSTDAVVDYNHTGVHFTKLSDMEVPVEKLAADISSDLYAALNGGLEKNGHKIKLKVYDANYLPGQIDSDKFKPVYGMPPSLAMLNRRNIKGDPIRRHFNDFRAVSMKDNTGTNYFKGTYAPVNSSFDVYRDYGAYMLQADLYRGEKLVSRTEEVIYMFFEPYD